MSLDRSNGQGGRGDQAFRDADGRGTWQEMTYGGAVSFARRRYSRDLAGADIVVSGIPYDNAVTYRPGCRLGPRAIRAGSVQLAELKHFPFGFDPFDSLSVVDYGDAFIDPHHPTGVFDAIESHGDGILDSDAMMLSLGGDHSVAYPLLKAHAKKHGPLALVQFDAHCDTWPDDGSRFDQGTMFIATVSTSPWMWFANAPATRRSICPSISTGWTRPLRRAPARRWRAVWQAGRGWNSSAGLSR
jgi:agmatinase